MKLISFGFEFLKACLLALLLASWTFALAEKPSPIAGGIVSSDEWKVRRLPLMEEEFIGHVRYRSAQNVLRSDWALYQHESQSWKARGAVAIEHKLASGELLEARGEEASFSQKTQQGSLTAPASVDFKRIPPLEEPDYGQAGRVDWKGQEIIALSGGVHIWGPRLEAWSHRADWEAGTRRLRLWGGQPVLRKIAGSWVGAIQADEISATDKPASSAGFSRRLVEASGGAKGWLEFTESPR
jgi:hypothetical protein